MIRTFAEGDVLGRLDSGVELRGGRDETPGVVDGVRDCGGYDHYYPLGGRLPSSTSGVQPQKYQGKDWDGTKGLDVYDFGARLYDPAVGRWLSQDPLGEKNYGHSPYLFCAGNPVLYVDPEGKSTKVRRLEDGTYEVVDVDVEDDDYNIYVATETKEGRWESTTESIGWTVSLYSFVDKKNTPMRGAIINPEDNSGIDFINDLTGNLRSLGYYMLKARYGHKYDFKLTNGGNTATTAGSIYRGLPILRSTDGVQFYGSARDVGNIVAGYYAAAYGFTWEEAREAFDAYNKEPEPFVSVYAQRFGYNWGSSLPERDRTNRRNARFLVPGLLAVYKQIKTK